MRMLLSRQNRFSNNNRLNDLREENMTLFNHTFADIVSVAKRLGLSSFTFPHWLLPDALAWLSINGGATFSVINNVDHCIFTEDK